MADDWDVAGAQPGGAGGYLSDADFRNVMDATFGKGKWTQTGGYRTQAREAALRAQGALTVAPGHTSAHSLGEDDAPGAHDIVVPGMSPAQVAARIQAREPDLFGKVFPEGAHGTQGAHLHLGVAAGTEGGDPWDTASADPWSVPKPPTPAPAQGGGFLEGAARLGKSLVGGVVSGAGELLKSAGELGDVYAQSQAQQAALTGQMTGPGGQPILVPQGSRAEFGKIASERQPVVSTVTDPWAASIGATGDAIAPTNRSGLESFAHGAGEIAAPLSAAVINPALGGVAFGAMGYGASHDEAVAKGADEGTAQTAGLENAGVQGALGMVPVGELTAPLTAGLKGLAGFGARIGTTAVGDATLGAAMQTGTNLVAAQNYDPDRPWYDQVPQSAAMMAAGGVAVHGVHEAIGAGHAALRPRDTPAAEPGFSAPVDAATIPQTDAIRAYAGKPPIGEPARTEPWDVAPAPGEAANPAAIITGDDVLFDSGGKPVHGRVVDRITTDIDGVPTPMLDVKTPVGVVPVAEAKAVALPAEYEAPRIAAGAPLEQMPQAIADVTALRNAAPRGYSLFQAIKDLGGIKTKDVAGTPNEIGDILAETKRPGLINNQTGMDPDAMREALQQRGWFGEVDTSAATADAARQAPGGVLNDLYDAMRKEASGADNRVYHPTAAAEEAHRTDLDDQMAAAGVALHDPVPEAAAKLAAWRGDQVKSHGADAQILRARAEDLGVRTRAEATYDEILADVLEAEATRGEGSPAAADHYEGMIDAELTPEEHEWLASAGASADGEHVEAFPLEATAEGAGAAAGPETGAGEPGAGAAVGGRDQTSRRVPRGDALEPTFTEGETRHGKTGEPLYVAAPDTKLDADGHRAALALAKDLGGYYSSSSEHGAIPGFQFPSEAARTAFTDELKARSKGPFEIAEAHGPNGETFVAKPRGMSAAEVKELLPLAQRYNGRFAMGRAETAFQFRSDADRTAFMSELTGGAARDADARFAREPVFYSAVERQISNSPMKAASADQWKATLKNAPGIKQEELAWTGVNDWLDLFDKGEKVPKEKLQAFLHDNGVKVEERVLGSQPGNRELEAQVQAETDKRFDSEVADLVDQMRDKPQFAHSDDDKLEEIASDRVNRERIEDDVRDELIPDTEFSDWKLPGGENYKELLLTLPKEAKPPATHWNTPGVMAHVRFDERTAPDGKKVLFVQEVQSDWHQKGRDQGYNQGVDHAEVQRTWNDLQEAKARRDAVAQPFADAVEAFFERHQNDPGFRGEQDKIFQGYPVTGVDEATLARIMRSTIWRPPSLDQPWAKEVHDELRPLREQLSTLQLRVNEARLANEGARYPKGIPDAPFKSTWPALVMKRVIRWAVDNGFERVAWTTGEQQADRYDMTKHIGRLTFDDNAAGGIGRASMDGPATGGTLTIHDPNGNRIAQHSIGARGREGGAREELEEIVGKELTDKLLAAEPRPTQGGHGWQQRTRHLEGLDVKTGGEGMKAFYDRNLVNITNDLIKKHGGKVDKGRMNVDIKYSPETAADIEALIRRGPPDRPDAEIVAEAEALAATNANAPRRRELVQELTRRQEYNRAIEARDMQTPMQHGFDITPQLAEAVSGGQPLFKREGAGRAPAEQSESRVLLPGQPREINIRKYDNPTEAQQALIDHVDRIVGKIAPFADVHAASSIESVGGPGEYSGSAQGVAWRAGLRNLLVWSVEGPGVFTARHEAIHTLRQAGLFSPAEWGVLTKAAHTEGWMEKFKIEDRYGDLRIPEQIEEAIADKFGEWDAHGRRGLTGPAGEAFRKIAQVLDHVRDLVRQFLKKNPDYRDVFSRIERGDVGARFGEEAAAGDSAARFSRADDEPGAPVKPAGIITRLLGRGVDAIGHKVEHALERFMPDHIQDIGEEVRLALNPMASGSPRAQAEAKDFANGLREISYSHAKVDEWLAKKFTPEQRAQMYDAADEERVIRGRGNEPGPGEGKNRLPPELRSVVDELQARADAAFKRAQDLGMVKGEGQESYVPAMLVDASGGKVGKLKAKSASGGRGNLSTSTGQLRQRKYETIEETEAAAQRGFGEGAKVVRDIRTLNLATGKLEQAMAGRRLINKIKDVGRQVGEVTVSDGAIPAEGQFFTMPDHPAMVTWGPKLVAGADGKMTTVDGPDGKPIMEAKPLYIAKEFEGPLKAVLSRPDAALWRKLMDLKGKTMSVTMYNPLLHNMVIYGKAFPAMVAHDKLGAFTFKSYRDGSLVKKDPELMSRALQSGTVPIGHQGAFQDITSIATQDSVTPGKSWTAQMLAATLGMGSKERQEAIKRGVDKAGDVWHNEFLWNRVGDLQMGLWKAMTDHFQHTGMDQTTADRTASYFANMYAGSVPVEAMSRMARGILNAVLFSRSFHVTNLGGLKAIVAGLPTDVQAQIMRDAPAMLAKAQGATRSKAVSSLVLDFVAAWAGRLLAAGALAWLLNRPFVGSDQNEKGKEERVFVGYGPDGTASYMRLPFGKYVEEVKAWFTQPVTYAKQIMYGPTRLALQYLSNDMGFGRKAYDPYDKSLVGLGKNVWKAVGNLGSSFLPVGDGQELWDATTGKGQVRDDAAAALAGDLTGFSISHGAPGGPAVGDVFRAEDEHQYRVTEAMPAIRKQIKTGDVVGARAKMAELGIAPGLINYYIKVAKNPSMRLSGRKLADFNRIATPEQKAELQRHRADAAGRAASDDAP